VLLSYLREHDTIKRTMTVIKTRATRHDPMVRQFVIGPRGIVLDEAPPAQGKPDMGDEDLTGATLP
jgi:KaiC/GvpD/RAD55 family RecA-like ATPase